MAWCRGFPYRQTPEDVRAAEPVTAAVEGTAKARAEPSKSRVAVSEPSTHPSATCSFTSNAYIVGYMARDSSIALGEFEQLVLLAVLSVGDEAYAVPVRREIQRVARRQASRGAVYVTLDRLEQKGLLTSIVGEPSPERGGRARRFYRATPLALAALRRHRASLQRMWAAVDTALGKV